MKPQRFESIPPARLEEWRADGTPFQLVDTLTRDHFTAIHLPGAHNACVYEVTFLDQVKAITSDPHSRIVLYGAGDHTRDAEVAAEKLLRDGYDRIFVLAGGLAGWRSGGRPLAGEGVLDPPASQARLVLRDGRYRVDPEESTIDWAGYNPGTRHDGRVAIRSGELQVRQGRAAGEVVIDMTRIENRSLAGDDLQPVLLAHLHSDDFFFTRHFPEAVLEIDSGTVRDPGYVSTPNVDIAARLTLRGVEAPLDFTATVHQAADGTISARAHIDLDRTRWNVIYGSARFFDHLGMHLVYDMLHLEVRLVAHLEK